GISAELMTALGHSRRMCTPPAVKPYPLRAAGSTGRCNTGVKSLCGGFGSQRLPVPFVELTRNFVQMGLRVHRQVGSLRKILSQQAIGVLIGTALPRTLRIAEVNVDVGRERASPMIRQSAASHWSGHYWRFRIPTRKFRGRR